MQKQLLRLVEDKSKPVISVPTAKKGDLWNAESGKMHSLHQICYYPYSIKPELVDFAIRKYSNKGDIVLDPFCGRGTVGLQANLLGRIAWQSDINPLAVEISTAKSLPVGLDEVVLRLNEINFNRPVELSDYNTALYTFFHPQTYRELVNLKNFVESKRDRVNTFIEVLALSRLHGHTDSFFSGYTSPQIALSPAKQLQLNLRRRAEPEYRTVPPRIIRRAAQVLQDGFSSGFFELAVNNRYQMSDAKDLSWVGNESVDLIIAQPPLLEKYNYYNNHWLSYWFSDLEIAEKQNATFLSRSVEQWREFIKGVLLELHRVSKPDSHIFLVAGEFRTENNRVLLDEIVAEELSKIATSKKYFKIVDLLIPPHPIMEKSQVGEASRSSAASRVLVLQAKTALRRG